MLTARNDSACPSLSLDFEGGAVPVSIVRANRAKRYILRVRPARRDVQLTIPPHGSVDEARAFAQRSEGWLRSHLKRLPVLRPVENGTFLPYRGRRHIVFSSDACGGVWVDSSASRVGTDGGRLPRLCVGGLGSPASMRRTLQNWLRQKARDALSRAAYSYARLLGVHISRISIRDQKTRWGSCSAGGTLSFSWRLIMAPDHVLDYLAAHETVHLLHLNHSADYWRDLRNICPATDEAERWLLARGRTLQLYNFSCS